MLKKKNFKCKYKKLTFLKENIQNSKKIYSFKKKKWKTFINYSLKKKKNFIFLYDHTNYYRFYYNTYLNKKYKFSLIAKQKLTFFFGYLTRKYLKRIRNKSFLLQKKKFKKNKKNINFFFLEFLETRLDSILYRANFFSNFRISRQFISHGNVMVNSKKILSSSFNVKKGDLIQIKLNNQNLVLFNLLNSNKWPIPPSYLHINYKIFQILIIKNINLSKILYTYPFWLNLNILKKYFIK